MIHVGSGDFKQHKTPVGFALSLGGTKELFQFDFGFLPDKRSLQSPDCPHSIDQAGLKFRDLPASTSQVLELKECATAPD